VSCFKLFKTTFRKEKNNAMVINNHCELDKNTLASWVNKVLDIFLTQQNIKSGFMVTRIWPFNPKVMDEKTRLNEVYTTIIIHILYQNNDSSTELANDINQWGEGGVSTQLLNITTIVEDIGIRGDVNV